MKGFLTGTTIRGIAYGDVECAYTANGMGRASFPVIQGGSKSRGFKGFVCKLVIWGDENFDAVSKAVSAKGLAVQADGLLGDRAREAAGKVYSNVYLNVYRLKVQLSADDTELTEIPLIRAKKSEASGDILNKVEGEVQEVGEDDVEIIDLEKLASTTKAKVGKE